MLEDPAQPVVMFAFTWCEFCWAVRKLFARCAIPYRSVNIDSPELQAGNRGGDIRAALAVHTGAATIPQVFVGGQHVGGAGELFDAFKDGRLQALLAENRVPFDDSVRLDPYTLMPGWLQPRPDSAPAPDRP
jgi:cysteine synthase A